MLKNNSQAGFSVAVIIVIAAIVLVGVSAYAYYSLSGTTPLQQGYSATPSYQTSDSDQSLESEIEAVNEGSVDADLNEIDASLNSL